MLWASPPAAGADADGRLLVDVTEFVLLVTEFLLSFVGTRAGRKLSSDIAARIQRAQRFQSFLGQGRFKEDMCRLRTRRSAWSQRVVLCCCLEAQTGQDQLQRS